MENVEEDPGQVACLLVQFLLATQLLSTVVRGGQAVEALGKEVGEDHSVVPAVEDNEVEVPDARENLQW
ncbi:hypothetical protein T265_05127 [Opisthorchis viverrini]|nr:hypothetical protein T265_05127 [Opisthorchis viverrini]KER27922.1 hypothetical protein T265_05127 [Opisthorchis viverrini]